MERKERFRLTRKHAGALTEFGSQEHAQREALHGLALVVEPNLREPAPKVEQAGHPCDDVANRLLGLRCAPTDLQQKRTRNASMQL